MLALSNVECDARSSHYSSFFLSFASKRLTDFFFSIDRMWSLDDSFMNVYSDVVEVRDLIADAQAVEDLEGNLRLNRDVKELLRQLRYAEISRSFAW